MKLVAVNLIGKNFEQMMQKSTSSSDGGDGFVLERLAGGAAFFGVGFFGVPSFAVAAFFVYVCSGVMSVSSGWRFMKSLYHMRPAFKSSFQEGGYSSLSLLASWYANFRNLSMLRP